MLPTDATRMLKSDLSLGWTDQEYDNTELACFPWRQWRDSPGEEPMHLPLQGLSVSQRSQCSPNLAPFQVGSDLSGSCPPSHTQALSLSCVPDFWFGSSAPNVAVMFRPHSIRFWMSPWAWLEWCLTKSFPPGGLWLGPREAVTPCLSL